MSKFADNLVDLAENTANYIRIIEEQNEMLREEKNYLLHKAGDNIAEIAKLQEQKSDLLSFAKFASDRASNFGDDWLWQEANLVISNTSGE